MKVYQIELTNICNMKCSFCPVRYSWSNRPTGYMNIDTIKNIDFMDTKYVELQLSGEPTLHPNIKEIIKLIHDKGIKVGLSTNGKDIKLLSNVIDDLDIVTVNNDTFRDPVFQDKNNVFVQTLGVDYPFDDYSHTVEYNVYQKCKTPFEYISIQWDGDVVPCCKSHGKQVVFGNVNKQSMNDIINGDVRKEFLNNLTKDNVKNGLCEFCKNPNPHEIHLKLSKLFLEKP